MDLSRIIHSGPRPTEEQAEPQTAPQLDVSRIVHSANEPMRTADGKYSVVDGDTVDVLDEEGKPVERLRISGIDTAEKSLATGQYAKRQLHKRLSTGNVTVERTGHDDYGRTIARLSTPEGDVGSDMVKGGARSPGYQRQYDAEAAEFERQYKAGTLPEEHKRALEANKPFVADPTKPRDPKRSEFRKGVVSGINTLQGTLYGAKALAGEVMRNPEMREKGLEGYERNAEEAAKVAPRVGSLKDVHGVGDAVDFALGQLGAAAPSLVTSAGAGTVGAIAGRKLMSKAIERQIGKGIEKTAKQMSKDLLTAGKVGAATGAAAASSVQGAGGIEGELAQHGISAPGTTVAGGILTGLLDALPVAKLIDELFPGVDRALAKTFIQGFAEATGKQALLEGTTESAQEVVALTARALHDPDFKWSDPEVKQRILDAGAGGAIVGAVTGSAGGVRRGMTAFADDPPGAVTGTRAETHNFGDDDADDSPPVTLSEEQADILASKLGGADRVPDSDPNVQMVRDPRVGERVPVTEFVRSRFRDAVVSVSGGKDRFGVKQKGNWKPDNTVLFVEEGKGTPRKASSVDLVRMGMDLDDDAQGRPLHERIVRGVSLGLYGMSEYSGGHLKFMMKSLKPQTVVYDDGNNRYTWGAVEKKQRSAAAFKTELLPEHGTEQREDELQETGLPVSELVEGDRRDERASLEDLEVDQGVDIDQGERDRTIFRREGVWESSGPKPEYDPALEGQEGDAEQAAASARQYVPRVGSTQATLQQDYGRGRRKAIRNFSSAAPEQAQADVDLVHDLARIAGIENEISVTDSDGSESAANLVGGELGTAIREAKQEDPAGRVMFHGDKVAIYLSKRLNGRAPAARAAVIAHEMGHVVSRVYTDKVGTPLRNRLQEAHKKSGNPNFEEWMADQFVAWSSRRSAPKNAMEAFFKRVGAKLREMWELLTNKYGLDETFAEFMDGVAQYAKRGDTSLTHPVARHFESLGVVGSGYWKGLPAKDNFTPVEVSKAVANAVGPKLAKWERGTAFAKFTGNTLMDIHNTFTAMVDSRLRRMGFPSLVRLARKFHQRAGEGNNEETFSRAIRAARARFGERIHKILDDVDEERLSQLSKDLLRADGKFADVKLGREMRHLFDELYEYSKAAGLPIDKLENYYPIVYSNEKLAEGKQAFIDLASRMFMRTKRMEPYEDMAKFQARALKIAEELYESMLDETAPAYYQHGMGEVAPDARNTPNPSVGHVKSRDLWHAMNDEERKQLRQFMESDARIVTQRYISAVTKLAEYNRLFGAQAVKHEGKWAWNPNQKLEDLLELAVNAGATAPQMREVWKILDANFGKLGADISPNVRKASSWLLLYQNMRVLVYTLFASFVDIAGPAIRTGNVKQAFTSMVRAAKDAAKSDSSLREMARTYGIISDAFNDHVLTEHLDTHYVDPHVKALNEKFFKYTGVQWWTNFTRAMALAVGKDYIEQAAAKGDEASLRKLIELGLTPDDVKAWIAADRPVYGRKGTTRESKLAGYSKMSDADLNAAEKVAKALRRFGDEAILRPTASMRPAWASDPRWMLVGHLKSYMYSFQATFLNRIWHELNRPGVKPREQLAYILPMLALFPLAALGLELRELFQYGTKDSPYDKMDGDEYMFELAKRTGIFGLSQMAIDFNEAEDRDRIGLIAIAGPTLSQIEELVSTPLSNSIPRAVPGLSASPGLRSAVQDLFRE